MTLVAGLAGRRLARADLTEPEQKAGERTIDMVVGALRFRVPAAYLPSFIQSDPAPVRHVPSFAFAFIMPGPTPLTSEENRDLVETRTKLFNGNGAERRLVEVLSIDEIPDYLATPEKQFTDLTLTDIQTLDITDSNGLTAKIMSIKTPFFRDTYVLYIDVPNAELGKPSSRTAVNCDIGKFNNHLCYGPVINKDQPFVFYIVLTHELSRFFPTDISAAMTLISTWLRK